MLSKNVLSIDIGTYYTKLVLGKYKNKQLMIHGADAIPTPYNALHDGQITDVPKLKETIEKWLHEKKVKSKQVIFTLECSSIITRELILPYVKEKDFEEMFQYEVQQHFPTALEDYVIQYKKLEEIKEKDFKKLRILVAALPKIVVENYVELAKELHLKPLALDIHSNALSKLFHQEAKINDESIAMDTIAIIDLGYENINMNIIDQGIPQFNRLLAVGGKDLDKHIADSFDITVEEARRRKKNMGNLYDIGDSTTSSSVLEDNQMLTIGEKEYGIGDNVAISNLLQDVIRSAVDVWIEEMQRIFKFYTSRNPGNKIDKIYLLGGHANLPGISRYMENYFNIPTKRIETIYHMKLDNGQKAFMIEYYLNAMGAIIRR